MINLFIRPILTLNGWHKSNNLGFCHGLNDPQDFIIEDPARAQSNPYCFQFDENGELPYSEQLELSWHQEIRPKLGFGNG